MVNKSSIVAGVAFGAALVGAGYLVFQSRPARRSARTRSEAVASSDVSLNADATSPRSFAEGLSGGELDSLEESAAALEADWGADLTALPMQHAPVPTGGDDEGPPLPEQLGRRWLTQVTETEETQPELLVLDPDSLSEADVEPGSATDEDDETVREYIRKHRISSIG